MPVIKADCLRYAIAFRGLLSPATILNLVNVAPNFLTASSVVVHSYAAVLLEKILLMTIPDRPSLTPLYKLAMKIIFIFYLSTEY